VIAAVGGGQIDPSKFMLGAPRATPEVEPEDELIAFLKKKLPPAPTTLQVKTGPEGGINFEQSTPGASTG